MEIKVIRKQESSELYHHGVKGMKWGVRRYQNPDGSLTAAGKKRSRAEKDVEKLRKTALKYYDAVNKRNTLYDTHGNMRDSEANVIKAEKATQKLVKKLDKKYGSVSVVPTFEENGYVVKSIEATLVKLDKLKRVESINKSYTPVETYNSWRNESASRTNKEKTIMSKYDKKISEAKTQREKELLELEMMDELDDV